MNQSDKSWVRRSCVLSGLQIHLLIKVTEVKPQRPLEDRTGGSIAYCTLTVTKSTFVRQAGYTLYMMLQTQTIPNQWEKLTTLQQPHSQPSRHQLGEQHHSWRWRRLLQKQVKRVSAYRGTTTSTKMLVWKWAQYGLHWCFFIYLFR